MLDVRKLLPAFTTEKAIARVYLVWNKLKLVPSQRCIPNYIHIDLILFIILGCSQIFFWILELYVFS